MCPWAKSPNRGCPSGNRHSVNGCGLTFKSERRHYLPFNFQGPLSHPFRVQASQGMGDGYRLEVGAAEGPRLEQRRVQERTGANYQSRYPAVLQGHGVVHTARGAGPSIGDGGNHEVTPLGQGLHDLLPGRPGVNVLVQNQRVLQLKPLV